MGTIQSSIELYDVFTTPMMNIINAVNAGVSAIEQMQSTMNNQIDTTSLEEMQNQINQAASAIQDLDAAIQNTTPLTMSVPAIPEPKPYEIPIKWKSDNLKVFTGTGIERFEQEVQSTNNMLNTLNETQKRIAVTASHTNLLSPNMLDDMNSLQNRIQAIQEQIQTIENNPLNLGTDIANSELEQLRENLNQAVQEQELLNNAVENMDVESANAAYLQLSRTIGNTERYIRDNVNEQGRFNREIERGTNEANQLMQTIKGAFSAYMGIAGIKKAFDFVEDCTQSFNTQLNAETQLISVLANMLDEDYVSQFRIETTADTAGAINEINAIQSNIDDIIVPVSAESRALTAAFDQITEKAAEIQSRGIYGDEAMIAAAAEFSTYFKDTNAVEMMMDTLADYAMGMSGGGTIDSNGMVQYATNLGKIMSGSYDAMTKKGFEINDVQKAIIEGTATQEQIIAAIGEEYVNMSQDMQAAAAISQVIEESWAGLYENMSNTPEGKIIQLTNAWGDMKEVIGEQLYPYVLLFVNTITENWSTIESVVQGITIGLEYLLGVLSWVLQGAINFAQVVIDNWSWISPIIYGVVAALMAYHAIRTVVNAVELISKGIKIAMCVAAIAHGAAITKEMVATTGLTEAQLALNAAMYACPLTWVIIIIIALIAIIYAAVAAVNHFAGTTVSATGIICGAFMVALAFIGNIFVALWNLVVDVFVMIYNLVATVANFIGNVFIDPVGAVCRLFFDLADTVLSVLQTLASAIDTIFGSNLAGAVQGWRNSLGGWVDSTFGKGIEVMEKLNADDMKLGRFEYGSAWNAGYSFGEGIENSITNLDPASLFGTTDIPSPLDYASNFTPNGMNDINGIGDDVSDISGNTGSIADSLDITNEDLKYLRDIAEQEAINRFTTAEIRIEQTNNNSISSEWDLDGVVNGLTDAVNEAVDIIAEGVHT